MSKTCRINHCGRPQGIGTWVSLESVIGAEPLTLPVCEKHWQAVKHIYPLPPAVADIPEETSE